MLIMSEAGLIEYQVLSVLRATVSKKEEICNKDYYNRNLSTETILYSSVL